MCKQSSGITMLTRSNSPLSSHVSFFVDSVILRITDCTTIFKTIFICPTRKRCFTICASTTNNSEKIHFNTFPWLFTSSTGTQTKNISNSLINTRISKKQKNAMFGYLNQGKTRTEVVALRYSMNWMKSSRSYLPPMFTNRLGYKWHIFCRNIFIIHCCITRESSISARTTC